MSIQNNGKSSIAIKLAAHLKKYLLLYSLLTLFFGVAVGYLVENWAIANKDLLANLIKLFVFTTIYPMMILLDFDSLKKGVKEWKPVLLSTIYIFVWAPLFAIFLAGFINETNLALGFLLAVIVPCSSMTLGYVGLADGDMGIAVTIVTVSYILALFAIPGYLQLYAGMSSVALPMGKIINTVILLLALPLVLGLFTREYLIDRKLGVKEFNIEVKPYLSATTILSMLVLVFLIVLLKAHTVIVKWLTVLEIIGLEIIFIVLTLSIVTIVNKAIKIPHTKHVSIIFPATSKNEGMAAAVAVSAINPVAALVPAVWPIAQLIILVAYLHLLEHLKKSFIHGEELLSEEEIAESRHKKQ